jgi:CBS domain-containing protein
MLMSAAGSLPVAALIGAPVVCVDREATMPEAAGVMASAGVGALVVGTGDDPAAIVTEHDLVGIVATGVQPDATRVGDVASTTLVWCDVDATVAEVAELMMERYVRHVLVEDQGRLVGVVSARDLLGAYASDDTDDESRDA